MATPKEHFDAAVARLYAVGAPTGRVFDSSAPADAPTPFIIVHTTPPYAERYSNSGREQVRSWRIVLTYVGKTPEGVRDMQDIGRQAFARHRVLPTMSPARREFSATMNRDPDTTPPTFNVVEGFKYADTTVEL